MKFPEAYKGAIFDFNLGKDGTYAVEWTPEINGTHTVNVVRIYDNDEEETLPIVITSDVPPNLDDSTRILFTALYPPTQN